MPGHFRQLLQRRDGWSAGASLPSRNLRSIRVHQFGKFGLSESGPTPRRGHCEFESPSLLH